MSESAVDSKLVVLEKELANATSNMVVLEKELANAKLANATRDMVFLEKDLADVTRDMVVIQMEIDQLKSLDDECQACLWDVEDGHTCK